MDVATLTGAARVALGTGNAAVFGNDDGLVKSVMDAAEASGDGDVAIAIGCDLEEIEPFEHRGRKEQWRCPRRFYNGGALHIGVRGGHALGSYRHRGRFNGYRQQGDVQDSWSDGCADADVGESGRFTSWVS